MKNYDTFSAERKMFFSPFSFFFFFRPSFLTRFNETGDWYLGEVTCERQGKPCPRVEITGGWRDWAQVAQCFVYLDRVCLIFRRPFLHLSCLKERAMRLHISLCIFFNFVSSLAALQLLFLAGIATVSLFIIRQTQKRITYAQKVYWSSWRWHTGNST